MPGMVEIRMLKDAPKIVGADFMTYGPFLTGHTYVLPRENASIMVKMKMAEYTRKEPEKPPLKAIFKGEVLEGYVEAAKVVPLDVEEKRKKLKEEAEALIKSIEEEIKS